ncbi:MAG TPA: hypothetical protein VFW83_01155 [Bryobacteraceae bacterium]|nr:hypothetical protein [Bryobacteraceae bacterium]
MPTATYEELLVETLPQVIETYKQYSEITSKVGDLAGKGKYRTPQETKLMRLLALLVKDYDRRNAMPPEDIPPHEMLQLILEHSGKKPSDLLSVFGQRSHVNEAINGKRKISADQARALGKMFSVKPGLFI